MRATQSDLYKTFIHGHHCVIHSKNRSSCKMCRFNKCLQVGMKINYVKTLEEKCKKVLQSNQIVQPIKLDQTTFQEKEALEAVYDANYEISATALFEIYAKNPTAFLSQVCQATNGSVNTDEYLCFMDFCDVILFRGYCHYLTDRDGISNDSEVLIKHNFNKLSTFHNILCFVVS